MAFDWYEFLKRWSQSAIQFCDLNEHITLDMLKNEWLGYAAATEAELETLEDRIEMPLPPSYKAFLRVSNGWAISGATINRLFSTEQVDWYGNLETLSEELIAQGFDGDFFADEPPEEDLYDTLQITEVGDSDYYLLNPKRILTGGEWEAWHYGAKIPGAIPFQSFEELMRHAYTYYLISIQSNGGLYRSTESLHKQLPELERLLSEYKARYTFGNDSTKTHEQVAVYKTAFKTVINIRKTAKNSTDAMAQLQDYLAEIDQYAQKADAKAEDYAEISGLIRYWLNE